MKKVKGSVEKIQIMAHRNKVGLIPEIASRIAPCLVAATRKSCYDGNTATDFLYPALMTMFVLFVPMLVDVGNGLGVITSRTGPLSSVISVEVVS